MGDWRADRQERINNQDAFFWVVPAKVKGRWNVESGNRKFEIEINQRYQVIEGVARQPDRTVPLRETNLRGDEIRFIIELEDGKPELFRGRVTGDKIEPLPVEAGPTPAAPDWRAARPS
jgi:hypothetical protein